LAILRIHGLQQRRQQAEYKFRALLESAPDAMVIVNNKGIITLINEQTEKLFQYPREELLGQAVEILIPEQHLDDHVIYRNHFIGQPKTRRMGIQKDLYGKKKDGTHIPLEISLSHLESDEGMLIASAIRDISDRKETEAELREYREHLQELVAQRTAALEASNQELESYSHSIAHDLRQPLRSITSFSQILLEDANDKLNLEEKDSLNRIATAGKKMSRLIEDILELSRITRCELHPVSLDLSDLSRRILILLETSQPERVVLTQVQEGISAHSDPQLMEIALQELFDNAWKFTRDTKTPKIVFGCRTIGDTPTFYVQDNGVGFDMTYADTLFKPFHHPHSGSETEVTGIGLAMTQRAIQRHGGMIWAESKPQQGMTVYFTLG
jgi:PAS domain S-box-containing protein